MTNRAVRAGNPPGIPKCPTGIMGLDEVLEGGLPRGRPTLLCGGAGCGKTVLGLEFLARGVLQFNEPGVFMAFEESEKELCDNVRSMGFDLQALCARKKLFLDHVQVDRSEMQETGDYDLTGLFIRLEQAIKTVGAKRVVIDTIESLFASFSNLNILRAEVRRLFSWLKAQGVTVIVTAETADGQLTRYSIEEYVADCVIKLDNRVCDQMSVRRIRVVKYRGTVHGANEYPFVIGRTGFSVFPLSSLTLDHKASNHRISSGIAALDGMLGGKGFWRNTSILITGGAGTGKSSLASHFTEAACRRGERVLYIACEQSADEVARNMRSIGIDLSRWMKRNLLTFYSVRPSTYGLERHIVRIHDLIEQVNPGIIVVDPISSFVSAGTLSEVRSMLARLIDMFKSRGITAMFTCLTSGSETPEESETGVSSLMDTWVLLRNPESNGERNRAVSVLKSRGMAHSNQVREFVLTDGGIKFLDVYEGPGGRLTGTARVSQQDKERHEVAQRRLELERKSLELKLLHQEHEFEIARMRSQFQIEEQRFLRRGAAVEPSAETSASQAGPANHAHRTAVTGNGRRSSHAVSKVTREHTVA